MTIAAEGFLKRSKAGEEEFGNNYIHYYGSNYYDQSYGDVLAETKAGVIDNILNQWKARKMAARMQLVVNSGVDENDAEALLNGAFITNLAHQSRSNLFQWGGSLPQGATEAYKQLKSLSKNQTVSLDEVLISLDKFLEAYNQADLLNEYADYVINHKISSKNLDNQFEGTKNWQNRILASFLSKYQNSFFNFTSKNGESLKKSLAKLSAIAKAISVPGADGTAFNVRHGYDLSNSKTATGDGVAKEVLSKILGIIEYMDKTGAEKALELGLGEAVSIGAQASMDIKMAENISTKGVEVFTRKDTELGRLADQAKTKGGKEASGHIFGKTTSKIDVGMEVRGANQVAFMAGFIVKDYKDFYIKGKKANIKLQDGTPLLTILMREMHFNVKQMNSLYNLAANKNKIGSNALNRKWNDLIEQVKYKSFISFLAGMPLADRETLYFATPNNIYLLEDIIEAAVAGFKNGSMSISFTATPKDGLTRNAYSDMNKWIGKKIGQDKDIKKAFKRSYALEREITKKLYDTKIRVNLNGLILSNLHKIN